MVNVRETVNIATVSLRAGSLQGTGQLAWGEVDFCVKDLDPFTGEEMIFEFSGPFSVLFAEMVGPKDSGSLFLSSPDPFFGP